MGGPLIELTLLSVFLSPIPLGLLHVALTELHKPVELAIGLEHSNAFDDSLLASLESFRALGSLLGNGGVDSNERVCHFVLVVHDLLIDLRSLPLQLIHGHVLFIACVVCFVLIAESMRYALRGLESIDSFSQRLVENGVHVVLLFGAGSISLPRAGAGHLRTLERSFRTK